MRISLLFAVGMATVCLSHRVAAQVPCPPVGIETDPSRSTNPGGTPNTFNWYYGDYQPSTYNGTAYKLNSAVDPIPYIDLPWQQPSNVNMERFQGKNDIGVNGWELIRKDLGYNDAGNPLATSNPFVIIYNKYLGVLRVFVTVQRQLTNFQLAEVALKFSTAARYKAATLNRQSALGVPLIETEKGTNSKYSVVSRYLNDGRKWFVADFPVDYDPCVCQFDSRFSIEVNLIKRATVNLQATSTGSIVTSTDASSGTSSGPSFFKTVNGAINAAGTSFDSVDKLTAKLKNDGGSAAALDNLNAALKSNSFLQKGLSSIPYLGAAIGLLDFFTGGGQDSAPQPLALQPLAIQMSTTTTGTIQDTSLYVTPYFFNPGNRIAQTRPSDVPNYNEALGVLSVLRRPVVEYTTSTTTSGTRGSILRKYIQTFRLTQDLQYIINPASGLTVQDFQVALLAEGDETTKTGSGSFGTFESNTVHVDPSGNTVRKLYRTAYYDAACIKNTPLTYTSVYQSDDPSLITSPVTNMYIKLMLNLKPTPINGTPSSTQQNVLLVARYPLTMSPVSSLSAIPTAACGVLAQASSSDIQAVCSDPTYQNAVLLLRAPQPVATAGLTTNSTMPTLAIYPNPAASSVTFGFSTSQAGYIRIVISDVLGHEVKQIVAEEKTRAGSFEASASVADLNPGIYYCTMQTPAGRTVQKLVVTH